MQLSSRLLNSKHICFVLVRSTRNFSFLLELCGLNSKDFLDALSSWKCFIYILISSPSVENATGDFISFIPLALEECTLPVFLSMTGKEKSTLFSHLSILFKGLLNNFHLVKVSQHFLFLVFAGFYSSKCDWLRKSHGTALSLK